MKYSVFATSQYRRDLKKIRKRGLNIGKLECIIDLLSSGEALPAKHRDHALTGRLAGFRECHIEPDWLLIYEIRDDILVLALVRTGSHSDLF